MTSTARTKWLRPKLMPAQKGQHPAGSRAIRERQLQRAIYEHDLEHGGLARRAAREAAGVEAGDTVDVQIELDQKPREVELPVALADAFAGDAEARVGFDRLSYARGEETRQRRVTQALERLRQGRPRN